MAWLGWIGGAMVAVGLAGLIYCILSAMRLKKAELPEDAARAAMHRLAAINMGALAFSFLGLGVMAAGLIL